MFYEILEKLDTYKKAETALSEHKKVQLNGCVPVQMEHFISGLGRSWQQKLIVTYDEVRAAEIRNNYMSFDKNVLYYPALDPMFYKADIQGSYISEQRLEVTRSIYNGENITIVTTLAAFRDRLASFADIREKSITLRKGGVVDGQELAARLVALGYDNESQVAGHGEFSVRGNIIDIFPYTESAPYRLDLWGDTIETIKVFDVDSQRSIEEAEEFTIFAGGDRDESERRESTFLDYFKPETALIIFDEPARIYEEEEPLDTKDFACLYLSMLGGKVEGIKIQKTLSINTKNVASYNGRFEDLISDVKKYKKNGWDVRLCAAGQARADNLRKSLVENEADATVFSGAIRTGFEYPDIKFVVVSEVDIFGQRRLSRRRRKRFTGDAIKDFTDLNIGDYVVHEQHGIGTYLGIERIVVDGTEKDYMKIQYAGGANLYVLATQFDKIQKYSGAEGAKPKINKLGGKEWANTKARVRGSVQDIAGELVRLYAARQAKQGYSYGPDTVWQKEFEEAFEFEETEDQRMAIEAVKADMESTKIMDRLICGDVGFGKTEVAIRAAFKAVQEGKQVVFLVPTTILAQQHYNTISQRVAPYPVTVRMLSRFNTPKQTKDILKEIQTGMADIVVGTHRLLSKDVKFKNLGLLVVDEEQRFGVGHKEKIKQLRQDIDVLTLSATPIPRTLHMSLTGIRDMSLLTEPPVDRVPIQTYVMEYSEAAVQEAILREARRGGQVYYVYNRTNNIDHVAAQIQDMVPGLNVRFAHGQMSTRELEQIMYDFIDGEIDVLVSTTIIETGLDISNVNTIIIHDADKFGLSQLYQLRGRVGRSNRTAYAFLMYRRDKLLQEVAEKRLKAIREFSELGSGIKIAMRDLEIRGAGNILGAEQSGHMEAVGYELYCKLLNEAVALLKGETVSEDYDTTVDLRIDGFIPASYIKNEYEKLNMYKKISNITCREEMEDIHAELEDRFGEVPSETENLLNVALIRARAHDKFITEISGSKTEFKICMFRNAKIDTYKMHGFLNKNKDTLKFVADSQPYFVYRPLKVPRTLEEMEQTLGAFFDSLDEIMEKEDE